MVDTKFITADLAKTVLGRVRPGITVWNRLEGRPRSERFDRALRAEIRDPLWLLTRQWQMGEFRGDDAASPFFAKVHVETTRLRTYRSTAGEPEPLDEVIPLEPHVEARPIGTGAAMTLDLRLMLGRQWLKLIAPVTAGAVSEFIDAYPIVSPDPSEPANAAICAHPEAWADFAAVAGRRMDGAALLAHLADPAHHAADGIAALTGLEAAADAVAVRFVAWYRRLIVQPDGLGAWEPDRLEYRFAVSSPQGAGRDDKVFIAEEYYQGHLDWYDFDIDPAATPLGPPVVEEPVSTTLTMLPGQAKFNGMPNTRWWAFEDGRTNFGDIRPDTTDLAKLLLIEFGLVYANDWLLVPFTVPVGTLANVRGIAVSDVFGERVWVEPAGAGDQDDWRHWAMFLLSTRGGSGARDLTLMLPPVAQQVLEARPLEDVMLARDEMANMVWAVERTIALPSGATRPGREAAHQTRSFFERDLEHRLGAPPPPPPTAPGAEVRYRVMSSVPENWIPMVPVHVPGDTRETQLQRGAMLRILEGDPVPSAPVRPRTELLRFGLDALPPQPLFIHEEEVPRAGVRVTLAWQRTRGRDGRVCLWRGVRKITGRGEGSSGLAFDRLEELGRPS